MKVLQHLHFVGSSLSLQKFTYPSRRWRRGRERELWRSGWSIDEAPDLTQVPVPSLNLDSYPITADIYRIWLWKQITNDFQILGECFQSSSSSRSNAWTWIWAYSPFYSFFFTPPCSFLCVVLPFSFTLPTRFSPPSPRLQIEFTAQCIFDRD